MQVMRLHTLACILALVIQDTDTLSSPLKPFTNYTYSTSLKDKVGDLWWTVDAVRKEITFEMHIKTTGWIALGISPGQLLSLLVFSSNQSLSSKRVAWRVPTSVSAGSIKRAN